MTISPICIYIKNGKYKSLWLSEGHERHEKLIKKGWRYTASVSPQLWMERFLNGDESRRFELIESISDHRERSTDGVIPGILRNWIERTHEEFGVQNDKRKR